MRIFREEDISEGSTGNAADICLLMNAEKVGISAFDGEAAGVVVYIIDHRLQLIVCVENTLMIASGIWFPYAVCSRKNARKVQNILHFSDIFIAALFLFE